MLGDQIFAQELRGMAAAPINALLQLRYQHTRQRVWRDQAALDQQIAKLDRLAARTALALLAERIVQLRMRNDPLIDQVGTELAWCRPTLDDTT